MRVGDTVGKATACTAERSRQVHLTVNGDLTLCGRYLRRSRGARLPDHATMCRVCRYVLDEFESEL